MELILWILAVILVIALECSRCCASSTCGGIVLIIVGFLVGPGGVSIFN